MSSLARRLMLMAVNIWRPANGARHTMNDSAQLWRKFCADLEHAGQHVLGSHLPTTETEKAEGLRYLTRLLRIGLDMHLENADPAFPSFYQASHETAKIGADNPDNFYQNATISGEYNYKITGQRGSVPILSFATKANRYAVDGTMASTGELDIRDVKMDAAGNFEIIISGEKSGQNWLPLEADSTMLIVRQTFFDKETEIPAQVKIERVGAKDTPVPLSFKTLSSALTQVPAFVGGTSNIFHHWAELFRKENRNALNTVDQSMFSKAGGDPMIYYLHGWWDLAPDEVMQITSEIPDCEGWNFQLNNIWMESLDYRHHNIHTNNGLAEIGADGRVSLNVSAKPQASNWIDTAGHNKGTMLWRWTGAKTHPLPHIQIIKQE